MKRLLTIVSVITAMTFALASTLSAQSKVGVKGKVSDTDGEPLIGVAVIEQGTSNGVMTDAEGNYVISVTKTASLLFDYMGFKQVIRPVSGRQVIDVVLEEDRTQLDEAVVVGYGTMRRSDLTGSVSSVSAKSIENFKTGNVLDALGGAVAGVNITTTDGTPGSGFSIIIRGVGTVNGDSSPLYIVDGFEADGIDHIANQDIASIEILKDASAAAIYGARAANGVVLVTTKSGREARAVVSYSGSASYRTLSKRLDVLNPYDFVNLQIERNPLSQQSYYATGNDQDGIPYRYQNINDYKGISGINWQDEAFQNTWSQNHDISLSGGTKTTKYAISFSHFDEDGIFINSGYIKNAARVKLNQKVRDWLDIDLNLSYTNQRKYGLGTGGWVLRNILAYRPTGGLGVTDDVLLHSSADPGVDNSYNNHFNPLVATRKADLETKTNTWVANGSLTFKLTKDLRLKTAGSYNQAFVRDDYFYYEGSEQAARSGGAYGQSTMTMRNSWSVNNVLTYNTKIASRHKITAMVGQEYLKSGSEYLRGQAKQFAIEDLGVDKLNAGDLASLVETSRSDKKRLSFFARGFYNYDDRYMATVTFRADASSVFAKGNRWGFFPSFAGAWTISNEPWMKQVSWIDNLKLRLGYGTVGNDRISSYMTSDIYTVVKVGQGMSQTGALLLNQLSNPNLKWEGSTTTNIGLDFSVLNGRVGLTADVFQKDTKDLLMQQNLSYISGWESQWQNVGKIRNKGLEISLKTININKKDFSWSTDFNISFLKNELVSLLDGTDYMQVRTAFDSNNTNNDYIAIVGQPLGNMYGFEFDGVYQVSDFIIDPEGNRTLKEGVVDNSSHVGVAPEPGFVKYKDQPTVDTDGDGIPDKGDGKITSADRTIIGNGYADWYGGMTNTFHFYGFDLSVVLQFSYGNDVFNVTRYLATKTTENGLNMLAEVKDRWVFQNASNAVPATKGMTTHDIYSRFIEDGSYLRLKNLTLGYSFPSKWMSKARISKLRLYLSANNLYCLTRYSGFDPEVNWKSSPLMPGVDYGCYPKNTAYTMGLEITF